MVKIFREYVRLPRDSGWRCVMCDNIAEYIAPETGEPLCSDCCTKNDEARRRWEER